MPVKNKKIKKNSQEWLDNKISGKPIMQKNTKNTKKYKKSKVHGLMCKI